MGEYISEARAARMARWWLCVIEGYNDALAGKPIEHCMYEGQEHIAWKHGWRSRAWAAQEEARFTVGISHEGASWAMEGTHD